MKGIDQKSVALSLFEHAILKDKSIKKAVDRLLKAKVEVEAIVISLEKVFPYCSPGKIEKIKQAFIGSKKSHNNLGFSISSRIEEITNKKEKEAEKVNSEKVSEVSTAEEAAKKKHHHKKKHSKTTTANQSGSTLAIEKGVGVNADTFKEAETNENADDGIFNFIKDLDSYRNSKDSSNKTKESLVKNITSQVESLALKNSIESPINNETTKTKENKVNALIKFFESPNSRKAVQMYKAESVSKEPEENSKESELVLPHP